MANHSVWVDSFTVGRWIAEEGEAFSQAIAGMHDYHDNPVDDRFIAEAAENATAEDVEFLRDLVDRLEVAIVESQS